jgi:hypothetical protein
LDRVDLRVEVLGYSALMEPPPTERIDNRRGNVIFMFAPFLRCYRHALDDPACVLGEPLGTFPPANRLKRPMNHDYFRFLKGWLAAHEGTNYVFDYYCWLPIQRDIFEGDVAKAMCLDMQRYPSHGFDGMVDCSRAQSFWPTPLARWMQARGGWDASIDYDQERRRLLELTFGAHARAVGKPLQHRPLLLVDLPVEARKAAGGPENFDFMQHGSVLAAPRPGSGYAPGKQNAKVDPPQKSRRLPANRCGVSAQRTQRTQRGGAPVFSVSSVAKTRPPSAPGREKQTGWV